jgi:hypothetical protein
MFLHGWTKSVLQRQGMNEPEEAMINLVKPATAGRKVITGKAMNSIYWVIFMGLLINIPSLAAVLFLRKTQKDVKYRWLSDCFCLMLSWCCPF